MTIPIRERVISSSFVSASAIPINSKLLRYVISSAQGLYLHDGRYPTLHAALRERLVAYMIRETSIRDAVDLAEAELDALVAFLGSLTGQIDSEYIATAD
jgi:hypothetical protein